MLNTNYIIATGPRESDLETAVMNLANAYRDSGFTDPIEFYRYPGQDLFLMLFPNQPDYEHFAYFVNFMKYPIGVNYNAHIQGYWTIKAEDKILPELVGKRIMLYVSDNDTDHVNVQFVTEAGQTFYYDFGGNITPLGTNEKEFLEADLNLDDFEHRLDIVPGDEEEADTKKGNKGCLFFGLLFFVLFVSLAYVTARHIS